MSLKFRLKGLAETFIDHIECPGCETCEADDKFFSTEYTRVTLEGIIVIVQCKACGEIFVPNRQRLGIMDPRELRKAVELDSVETGEPVMPNIEAVKLHAEKINASRRGEVH
ncbi:MAG: hypothetical protein SGJ02_11275 [bacterium]|nr:hypothetical protein [bacterium]